MGNCNYDTSGKRGRQGVSAPASHSGVLHGKLRRSEAEGQGHVGDGAAKVCCSEPFLCSVWGMTFTTTLQFQKVDKAEVKNRDMIRNAPAGRATRALQVDKVEC